MLSWWAAACGYASSTVRRAGAGSTIRSRETPGVGDRSSLRHHRDADSSTDHRFDDEQVVCPRRRCAVRNPLWHKHSPCACDYSTRAPSRRNGRSRTLCERHALVGGQRIVGGNCQQQRFGEQRDHHEVLLRWGASEVKATSASPRAAPRSRRSPSPASTGNAAGMLAEQFGQHMGHERETQREGVRDAQLPLWVAGVGERAVDRVLPRAQHRVRLAHQHVARPQHAYAAADCSISADAELALQRPDRPLHRSPR